eukprot:480161-Rhodomonas_salina.4
MFAPRRFESAFGARFLTAARASVRSGPTRSPAVFLRVRALASSAVRSPIDEDCWRQIMDCEDCGETGCCFLASSVFCASCRSMFHIRHCLQKGSVSLPVRKQASSQRVGTFLSQHGCVNRACFVRAQVSGALLLQA